MKEGVGRKSHSRLFVIYTRVHFLYFKGVINLKVSTRKQLSLVSLIVLIGYICVLTYFVFFSDHYGRVSGFTDYRYNLIPFAEINRYLTYNHYFTMENLLTNLAGNILVFSPIGFLVPIIKKEGVNIFTVFRISFLLTLFIETVQLVFRIGVFDVDDLIMNTMGGVVGFVCFKLVQRLYRKWLWHKLKKEGRV